VAIKKREKEMNTNKHMKIAGALQMVQGIPSLILNAKERP